MPKISMEKQEYFKYLDELSEGATLNMHGASPLLQNKFKHLSHSRAVDILMEWFKTHSERHKEGADGNG